MVLHNNTTTIAEIDIALGHGSSCPGIMLRGKEITKKCWFYIAFKMHHFPQFLTHYVTQTFISRDYFIV